jgi:hypothetical protein
MAMHKHVHDDEDVRDEHGAHTVIDIHRITGAQLALVGLTPERVDLYNSDELIRLYEKTFAHVGPDEYWSIRNAQMWHTPDETPEATRKEEIWHIRWAVAARVPELLKEAREQGEDIAQHLNWLHQQLIRQFDPPTEKRTFGERFWDKVLDRLLGAVGPRARFLDDQVLSEFLFSMGHREVFNEHTWEFLLKMRGHLRSEGYVHFLLLLGKVYAKHRPPGLKKYLEEQAARNESEAYGNERLNALIKTARVILEDKKLRMASPPYGVGIAIAE